MTTPLWLWPNLLSLDAPALALLWQHFLAIQYSIPLRPAGRAVLGLTVWAVYLADRLFDVSKPPAAPEPPRHGFYRRHFHAAAILLAGVLLADGVIAAAMLRTSVLVNGLPAAAGVLVYLTLVHMGSRRIPKEPLVALFFTAGTFLVAWTNTPARESLLIPAILFFTLCLANVVIIENWEWRELRRGASPPHRAAIALGKATPALLLALAAASIAAATPWSRAIAISSLIMLALLAASRRLSLNTRRAAIEAAMLSPLLFLFP